MKQNVAFLGLGAMGIGMVRNLLRAGFPVIAFNRTRAKAEAEALTSEGLLIADNPADAAKRADLIVSMLSDEDASRSVWTESYGALNTARPGTVLVESSTVRPSWILELAGLIAQRKLDLLDAPVTGGPLQAESGQLGFLVGGEATVLERVRPVLEAMSKEIAWLGPIGSGARMKLINNFLGGVQVASLAEAIAWIERSGLDREQAVNVLKRGAPGSPLLSAAADRMVQSDYGVKFLLDLMCKDLRYACSDAASLGVELCSAAPARMRFAAAADAGYGEKDFSAVVEPLRNL